jgi:hypothetical protein
VRFEEKVIAPQDRSPACGSKSRRYGGTSPARGQRLVKWWRIAAALRGSWSLLPWISASLISGETRTYRLDRRWDWHPFDGVNCSWPATSRKPRGRHASLAACGRSTGSSRRYLPHRRQGSAPMCCPARAGCAGAAKAATLHMPKARPFPTAAQAVLSCPTIVAGRRAWVICPQTIRRPT